MTRRTSYVVVSWTDQQLRDRGRSSRTREYGSASTKQAAIRLAERVLPPDVDYIITTIHRTVHEGRTPKVPVEADHRRWPTCRTRRNCRTDTVLLPPLLPPVIHTGLIRSTSG